MFGNISAIRHISGQRIVSEEFHRGVAQSLDSLRSFGISPCRDDHVTLDVLTAVC